VRKYSDVLARWLAELGYTHCFFVAGGNIMHLLESCSHTMTCVPVVHEVAAGIAAEYFNQVHTHAKAFAMVTAGPGMTNIVTALAGAFLESRELLVIGGQVKTSDLSRGDVRQRGIQEIDGVAVASPITEKSILMEEIVDRAAFTEMVRSGVHGRKGPIFLELPLDLQGKQVNDEKLATDIAAHKPRFESICHDTVAAVVRTLREAERPVILLGSGINRATTRNLASSFESLGIPLMLTWNAADRISSCHPFYFGRPNTWGMRSSNILLQQADVLLALGTRLSLQQTGFNWQEFVPNGKVIQVDCDPAELAKHHPRVATTICGDANFLLRALLKFHAGNHAEWAAFCREVRNSLPLVEACNTTAESYLSPYVFVEKLSEMATENDVVIPCSSGSAFTVMMQTFAQKLGQRIVTNKGLAAMGYGLSGAIGAAFAAPDRRTILIEGDGGFMQNMQELGTVKANRLNLKIFLFDDNGYASIRMTQRSYFKQSSIGCDPQTGLGIPNWQCLFAAYDIRSMRLDPGYETDLDFLAAFHSPGPAAFLVHIDPQQTYYPKIASRINSSGSMKSDPLHRMTPELDEATEARVLRYIPTLAGSEVAHTRG
jgi:acetolactate synthase-1/2/3 large subunit